MPTNITDVSTFTAPIQAPADGDAGNGATFLAGLQGLANRTAYLNNLVGTSGTGATRFRTVTSTTALAALSGQGNGDVALVANPATPSANGIYFFVAASPVATTLPFIVASTSGTPGTWFHELSSVLAAASGIATLTAASRLQQTPANANADAKGASYVGAGITNSSGSWMDWGGAAPVLFMSSGVIGDKLDISGHIMIGCAGGPASGIRIAVVDGASTIPLTETQIATPTTASTLYALSTLYTVANGGTLQVKYQVSSAGATSVTMQASTSLRAINIRP